jgi:hypothetical protein
MMVMMMMVVLMVVMLMINKGLPGDARLLCANGHL